MKRVFSTVLFVDGNPVGYKVCQKDIDHIIMNPAENPNREIFPPILHISNVAGSWEVEGTQNRDLIDQVMEEVRLNMHFSSNHFSAAP